MKKLAIFLAVLSALVACKPTKALLPSVSGKAGEVLVVIDKNNWEGDLGNAIRETLGDDCPFLAQSEPLYNLMNVPASNFSEMFQVHRNILRINIDPQLTEEGLLTKNNVWASPQCVLQIDAHDSESAVNIFKENKERILSTIEQAERDRIISNSKRYEETPIREAVTSVIGGSPYFPAGYKMRINSSEFFWIEYQQQQFITQYIYIYRYPAKGDESDFTTENIIKHRNDILKVKVPGMFNNTWMTTATAVAPETEYIRFRGRQFAQTRGFWEVHGDFMGGPFVSHSFYSPDGNEIIVLEALVYAPRFDKRQYLRQVESIIYSFEWDEKDETKEENADSE